MELILRYALAGIIVSKLILWHIEQLIEWFGFTLPAPFAQGKSSLVGKFLFVKMALAVGTYANSLL